MGISSSLPAFCSSDIESKENLIATLRSEFNVTPKFNIPEFVFPEFTRHNKLCDKQDTYYFNQICCIANKIINKLKSRGYTENDPYVLYELFVQILSVLIKYYKTASITRFYEHTDQGTIVQSVHGFFPASAYCKLITYSYDYTKELLEQRGLIKLSDSMKQIITMQSRHHYQKID
jgi:hypothetical protein